MRLNAKERQLIRTIFAKMRFTKEPRVITVLRLVQRPRKIVIEIGGARVAEIEAGVCYRPDLSYEATAGHLEIDRYEFWARGVCHEIRVYPTSGGRELHNILMGSGGRQRLLGWNFEKGRARLTA